MDYLPEKYLKNKITNSFINNSNENYFMPQKYELYKKQNSSKIYVDGNNNMNNNSQNISNYISVNERQERKTLLLEIDNIIEELEFFEKEKRKNELISIMKSITRNVDIKNIPSSEETLNLYFFGKTEKMLIEDEGKNIIKNNYSFDQIDKFKFNKSFNNNYNDNNNNDDNDKDGFDINIIDNNIARFPIDKTESNLFSLNKALMDDDLEYNQNSFIKKKRRRFFNSLKVNKSINQ